MLEVPVYSIDGKQIDTLKVEEDVFGGTVNEALLKQAVVAYHARRHQGTAANRSRGMVSGSTKKLFRQKGTGNARRGPLRTHKVRGGGVAFAKIGRKSMPRLPKGMRKAALKSAILAKILGNDLLVVDELKVDQPRTKAIAEMMKSLSVNRRCLLAVDEVDRNLLLSSRNLPDVTLCQAGELNAFDVATRPKMVVTRQAMQGLMNQENQS